MAGGFRGLAELTGLWFEAPEEIPLPPPAVAPSVAPRGLELVMMEPPQTDDIRVAIQWVAEFFREIVAVHQSYALLQLKVLHVEPQRPRDGMLVVADGTNWNPGAGAGVYARVGGSWVKL